MIRNGSGRPVRAGPVETETGLGATLTLSWKSEQTLLSADGGHAGKQICLRKKDSSVLPLLHSFTFAVAFCFFSLSGATAEIQKILFLLNKCNSCTGKAQLPTPVIFVTFLSKFHFYKVHPSTDSQF